jgi:hypothetical protein
MFGSVPLISASLAQFIPTAEFDFEITTGRFITENVVLARSKLLGLLEAGLRIMHLFLEYSSDLEMLLFRVH